MAVMGQRPEAEPPTVGAQRRLGPLLVVRVGTRKLFKAVSNMVVEEAQSIGVERRPDSSDGKKPCC